MGWTYLNANYYGELNMMQRDGMGDCYGESAVHWSPTSRSLMAPQVR